jgi:Flp pilus assembly pilin Flp
MYMEYFWRDERGQDLIEYTLLLAFIALSGAAAYLGISGSLDTLWTAANNRLAAANTTGS